MRAVSEEDARRNHELEVRLERAFDFTKVVVRREKIVVEEHDDVAIVQLLQNGIALGGEASAAPGDRRTVFSGSIPSTSAGETGQITIRSGRRDWPATSPNVAFRICGRPTVAMPTAIFKLTIASGEVNGANRPFVG